MKDYEYGRRYNPAGEYYDESETDYIMIMKRIIIILTLFSWSLVELIESFL